MVGELTLEAWARGIGQGIEVGMLSSSFSSSLLVSCTSSCRSDPSTALAGEVGRGEGGWFRGIEGRGRERGKEAPWREKEVSLVRATT